MYSIHCTYHNIIKIPPPHPRLGDQRRHQKRTQYRSHSIQSVQQSQHLIGIRHVPDPSVPRGIRQSVAESREDKGHHQHRVRGMQAVGDIRDEMASGSDDSDTALAEGQVDFVVEDGGEGVPG